MNQIAFKCPYPNCAGGELQEVMEEVTRISAVSGIMREESGFSVERSNSGDFEGGDIVRYQCGACGYIPEIILEPDLVSDVCTEEQLYKWLKERNMLEKEECRQ